MPHHNAPQFYEIQRFRNPWIRYSVAAITVGFILFFIPGAIKQLVYHEPWGNKPLSDVTLIAVGAIVLGLMFALCFFFFSLKLETVVTSKGVFVRLFPLAKRVIPFDEIVKCTPTTYSAIKEFGGWGVRSGARGKALTIYGDQGVELTLKDGQVLLIGSQRPGQLHQAISQYIG